VFRIDRECYVVYVGSDHHHVRPFLRVGTTPDIPDRIRQYIGTVVLTDRLTGDPTQESATVGPSVPRKPDYTGSHELIRSARPFFAAQRISERPIDSEGDDQSEGAFVEFLTDGTLNVMVNGHRVFDLARRERDDRHAAYQLDRVARAIGAASGRYRAETFGPAGFLVTADRSLFFFRDGAIEARALRPKGIRAFAERLVPLSLLTQFSGPVDTDGFLTLAKWTLRDGATNAAARTIRLHAAGALPGKLAPLVELFRAAGLAIEVMPADCAFVDLPSPASDAPGVSLAVGRTIEWPQSSVINLPDEAEWAHGVAPPLLPGVPYRLRSSASEVEGNDALESLAGDGGSAHALLARGLLAWNEHDVAAVDHAELARDVERLLGEAPVPVLADVYPTDVGYTVRFMVQHGFTLGDVTENRRAAARIAAITSEAVDEEFFLSERRRLLDFLDELLRQRRATVRREPSAPPQKTEVKKTGTTSGADPSAPSAGGEARKAKAAAASTAGAASTDVRSPVGTTAARASSRTSRRLGPLPVAAAIGLFLLLAGGGAYFVFRDRHVGATPSLGVVTARPADSESGTNGDARDADPTSGSGTPAVDEGAPDGTGPDSRPTPASQAVDDTFPRSQSAPGEATDVGSGDQTPVADGARSRDRDGGSDTVSGDSAPSALAAPETRRGEEQFDAFDGELEITALDVLILVNEIAVRNDYAPIGDFQTGAPSPDWIYPGNVFAMPDDTSYRVARGDTLWGIAETFIRRSMGHNHVKLTDIAHRIDRGERPIDELEALIGAAHSESIRREARELIRQLGV
ncbi:MAG: hypothetical protein MI724_16180, partial [Spirochaetales bacterium]|nr:hypothetical protein [Spirochaetales bacterium]